MKKIVISIIMMIISVMCMINYSYAAAQLEATIEITPSTTEVSAGDSVTFTFVTKNIKNAESGKIYAIGGTMTYDTNFFEADSVTTSQITLGSTGLFNSTTAVSEGATNGTITLKVKSDATGSGEVEFKGLEASDGRLEDMDTLGVAKTADQKFTIKIKAQGGGQTPCEHTYGNYTDNGNGTHSAECTKCKEKHTENHTYANGVCSVCSAQEPVKKCEHGTVSAVDNKDGTHSKVCALCSEKIATEQHSYQDEKCSVCGAVKVSTPEEPKEEGKKEEEKKDDTTAGKEIPKAGLNTMLSVSLISIIVLSVVMYRKNRKYQDIK